MKKIIILFHLFLIASLSFAQLSITDTTTQENMVKALEGPGVLFSNIVVDCDGDGTVSQMAQFDGTNSNLGVNVGLIMTSGDAQLATGPNNSDSESADLYTPGDLDLDIVAGIGTNDGCIVEFDMQISGDTLRLIMFLVLKNIRNL